MYHRILVPHDGSPTSLRGLDEAIELAALMRARLRIVYMLDELQYLGGFATVPVYPSDTVPLMREAGEEILASARIRAEKAGVAVDTLLLERIAPRLAEMVAEQVRAWCADLIVLGTHGRRGVGRLLLGSDAEQILRCATVPVLLVRAPDASAVKADSGWLEQPSQVSLEEASATSAEGALSLNGVRKAIRSAIRSH